MFVELPPCTVCPSLSAVGWRNCLPSSSTALSLSVLPRGIGLPTCCTASGCHPHGQRAASFMHWLLWA